MVSPSKRAAKKVLRSKDRRIYIKEKPAKTRCALCDKKLHGVPNRCRSELAKLAKTEKRPERPFGGVLCGTCTTRVVKAETRVKHGLMAKSDVDFRVLKYMRK